MMSQSSRRSRLVLAARVYTRKITSPRATVPNTVTGIIYIVELFVYVDVVIVGAMFFTATTANNVVHVSPYKRFTGMIAGSGERGSSRRVNSGA
jgi:hypothetical protein